MSETDVKKAIVDALNLHPGVHFVRIHTGGYRARVHGAPAGDSVCYNEVIPRNASNTFAGWTALEADNMNSTTKTCGKCDEVKTLDEFPRRPDSPDGLRGQCKVCCNVAGKRWREEHRDQISANHLRWRNNNPERISKYRKAFRLKNPAAVLAGVMRYQARHPERRAARRKVAAAVRAGTLVRPDTCSGCETPTGRIEGHHDDYNKPLVVRWLCRRCHQDHHNEERAA